MYIFLGLSVLLNSVCAFTKTLRTSIVYDGSTNSEFNFDPLCDPLDFFVQSICPTNECNLENSDISFLIEEMAQKKILDELMELKNILFLRTRESHDWIQYTDTKTQDRYIRLKYEIMSIYRGQISFHSDCNFYHNIEKTQCKYAKIATQFNLQLPDVSKTLVSESDIEDVVNGIEALFNAQLYAHAEAISYFWFYSVLDFKSVFPASVLSGKSSNISTKPSYDMKYIDYESLIRLGTILSEVSKVQGNLDISTTFSLYVIQVYSAQQKFLLKEIEMLTQDLSSSLLQHKEISTDISGVERSVEQLSDSITRRPVDTADTTIHKLPKFTVMIDSQTSKHQSTGIKSETAAKQPTQEYTVVQTNTAVHSQKSAEINARRQDIAHMQQLYNYSKNKDTMFRLRLILAIPPIPTTSAESQRQREVIVQDVKLFVEWIKRDNITVSLKYLSSEVSAASFHMAHQGLNDLEIQTELAIAFRTLCPQLVLARQSVYGSVGGGDRDSSVKDSKSQLQFVKKSPVSTPTHSTTTINSSIWDRKVLKIGFISSHFFDHSIGRILIELFIFMRETHIRIEGTEIIIDLQVYLIENPAQPHEDMITQILERTFGAQFIRLPSNNVAEIRERLVEKNLDFLFFADVGMDFTSYLLTFSRLARYQAAWWGHPITTGMSDSVDYFISLESEVHSADSHYSEQLVRMDVMNTVPLNKINKTEAWETLNYQHIHIPQGAKVALVLARLFKIHPEFDRIVVDILISLRDADNTYVVFVAENLLEYNNIIYKRIKQVLLNDYNGDGAAVNRLISKIRFVHFHYYRELLALASVVLDTYPYGGCLTSHDALANGIPMVTLPPEYIRGRFTLSMYQQMNHTDLVATSSLHYVQLVHTLLTNDSYHAEQSGKVASTFDKNIHKNDKVASEWLSFMLRVLIGSE